MINDRIVGLDVKVNRMTPNAREILIRRLGLTRMQMKKIKPMSPGALEIFIDLSDREGGFYKHFNLLCKYNVFNLLSEPKLNIKRIKSQWLKALVEKNNIESNNDVDNNYNLTSDADNDSITSSVTLESIHSAYSKK